MILLPAHVVGGIIAIASGFVALYAAKGAPLHRQVGMMFVYAMLVMSASGALMAMFVKVNRGNVMGGALTFYMVTTALLTTRARVGWKDLAATLLGLAAGTAGLTFALIASQSATGKLDGYPPPLYVIFGTIALLSVTGDIRMMRSGGLQGAPRIARHLWRMCFGLFIAAASFFLGPRGRIPEFMRIPSLLPIPVLAVVVTMLYWLWRVRVRRSLRGLVGIGARFELTPSASGG